MVLEELSSTHLASNGRLETSPQGSWIQLKGVRHPTGKENSASYHAAVQTMLKTSTEMGDVGEFARKKHGMLASSTRVPHESVSPGQAISSPSSQSLPAAYKQWRQNEGVDVLQHTLQSNPPISFLTHNESLYQQSYSRGRSFDEHRPHSKKKSAYVSQVLMDRRQYIHSTRHFAPGSIRSTRPRSPFVYPTRLKRPGYYPTSPASSDLNCSSPCNDFEKHTYRTASPTSFRNINGSITSRPRRHDQLEHSHLHLFRSPGPGASDPAILRPAASLRSAASSSKPSPSSFVDDGSWMHSQSSAQPPVFYDYTEAFEEQTRIHRLSISIVRRADPGAPDKGPQVVLEFDGSPEVSFIAELPSDINKASNNTFVAHTSALSPSRSYSSQVDQTGDANGLTREIATTDDISVSELEPMAITEGKTPFPNQVLLENGQESPEMTQSFSRKNSFDLRGSAHETTEQPVGVLSLPTDCANDYPALTSIQCEETITDYSSEDVEVSLRTQTPPASSNVDDVWRSDDSPRSGEEISPISTVAGSVKTVQEILAPTPERSGISRSGRDRLSKILSIDEGRSELEGFATSPVLLLDSKDMKGSLRSQESDSAQLVRGIDSHYISRHSDFSNETDSDGEKELSKGFRKTFCRKDAADDDHVSLPGFGPFPDTAGDHIRNGETHLATSDAFRASPELRLSHRKTSILQGLQWPEMHEETTQSTRKSEVADAVKIDPATEMTGIPSLPSLIISSEVVAPPEAAPSLDRSIDVQNVQPSISELLTQQRNRLGNDSLGEKISLPRKEVHTDSMSTISRSNSCPWNLDTSYPWNAETLKLDMTVPFSKKIAESSDMKAVPLFKLRIQRASSSTGGTNKLIKKGRFSEDTTPRTQDVILNKSKTSVLTRKMQANPFGIPGQSNSSHDVLGSRPTQTCFVQTFENPSRTLANTGLLPPSPGPEVQSFFSDDSSHIQERGSLRKRFSEFKSRHSRNASNGYQVKHENGLLGSSFGIPRLGGRSSRQSQHTRSGASQSFQDNRSKWMALRKLRSWFSRQDGKVRNWRRKRHDDTEASQVGMLEPYSGA